MFCYFLLFLIIKVILIIIKDVNALVYDVPKNGSEKIPQFKINFKTKYLTQKQDKVEDEEEVFGNEEDLINMSDDETAYENESISLSVNYNKLEGLDQGLLN